LTHIRFARPYVVGKELDYIQQVLTAGRLAGNGTFTEKCHAWLERHVGCKRILLTHSCTAALEMAAILADIKPGDEVIMPSYTFSSTANAFVLRGGVPVFVDIRPDTLNLDESQIESAITPQTKVVVPVHYAGVGCEMDTIMDIADRYSLLVIEDAAQGIMSSYKGRPLGNIGHMAAFSFHQTKNAVSGEGGALLLNNPTWVERAEIIWEKGTNRSQFFRGQVDKYTWVDIGSSYLPSEITAAFLYAQLEELETITQYRLNIWMQYHQAFAALENKGRARRPIVPAECQHNAHIYYLLLPDLEQRNTLLENLTAAGINAVFHYIPLHTAPAGKKYGRANTDLPQTQLASDCLIRLPLWAGMTTQDVNRVIDAIYHTLAS
jgi:dTDP-4-amino-4,6-dideoxygalactose transaminase